MNAHSHKEFVGLIPQQGDPRIGPNYEIELLEPLGNISAGDALIFDVGREPAAGEIVGLRRAGARGVEIGTLLTDLPKGRWELLRTFGNVDKSEDGTFMFRAMADDIVRFPKVSEFIGIDSCIDARVWPKYDDAPAPKRTKPTPARDAKGRFLPRGHAEAELDVEQAEERKPWEDVAAWTPGQRFMFDLEGVLYKMVALAEILETLTTPLTNRMIRHDRPGAAALDYASTNLVDAVHEIEERYMAVRFPDKADAA